MFKKYFFISLLLFTQSVFALQPNKEETISAIKSNPALLNTPQAQQQMLKMGLTKDQILKKIDDKNKNTAKVNKLDDNESLNAIDFNQIQDNKDNNTIVNTTYINPLKYKTNEQILENLVTNQVVKKETKLERFGSSFFKNKNNFNETALPVPSYYIINANDKLNILLYGTTNNTFNLTVDNNGNINIPKIGPLHVAGQTFEIASKIISNKLKKTYSNTDITINISEYSTIQVSLVGDVKAPGIYNVNALSTVKNLLIEAQGVKEIASLREILIKRDNKILAVIDFYNLLHEGDEKLNILLKSGDVIFVPKAKTIVSIDGAVNNPAKFELKDGETLKKLLQFSGGLKYNGSKYGFLIKRFEQNKKLKTYEVNLNKAKTFELQNGDKVYVYGVDKVHKESIYLYGNVVRPGERALNKELSLQKLLQNEIKNVSLKGLFLEQTLFSYAMIKRETDNLEKEIINFNLQDVLSNKIDVSIKNNDEVFIFNKYNSNISPYVTIKGKSVQKDGQYNFYENMKVKDLINIAGSTPYTKIRLTTYKTENLMPEISFVNENHTLAKFDEIELFDYYMTNEIKTVTINGAVHQPNEYTLNDDISLAKFIDIAGGFTQKAYKQHFEVIRYYINNDSRERKIITVYYDDIETFKLHADDEIKIFSIPNWNERKTVTLKGEIKFPGTYTIKTGEKLSSVINRAGGFTNDAFLEGALFTRESIKKNEEKRIKESISKLKQQMTFIATNGREAGTSDSSQADLVSTINMLETQTKEYVALGRLVVYLEKDLNNFHESEFNIKLEDQDTLIIPSINDTISIYGEVLNPNTFVYNSNLNTDDYIKKAGGITQRADKEYLYVVLPNGEAQSLSYDSWFSSSEDISKGSTIIVPMKINSVSNILLWKEVSQIVYQLAITAASLNTVGAI